MDESCEDWREEASGSLGQLLRHFVSNEAVTTSPVQFSGRDLALYAGGSEFNP